VNRVVAIVGMTGSGKSAACEVLRREGWGYVRFGQITIDRLIAAGWEITPDNEKKIREALRREHGMGVYARLLLPRIEQELGRGPVVLDGLYSWSEYKILREKYPDTFAVVAIHAAPAVRYARLASREETEADPARTRRRLSAEAARRRDYAEIEGIEKGGPIAMADLMIVNEGSLQELESQVRTAVLAGRPGRG
jgi:dephospho-CoA kinase